MSNASDNKGEVGLKTGGMMRDERWWVPLAAIILWKLTEGAELEKKRKWPESRGLNREKEGEEN